MDTLLTGDDDLAPRLALLFVDGIGLAPSGPTNPFSQQPTPALRSLLGGPLTSEQVRRDPELVLVPVEAGLGVDGLPQSATGQTTLFTGVNAAAALGRHVTAFPGPRLQAIIAESSLLLQLDRRGQPVAFANAFSRRYFELVRRRRLRFSVTVWAARAAGLRLRTVEDLRRGAAVSWDVARDRLARGDDEEVEVVTPAAAGEDLARLAYGHSFTLYETFLTDLAGHGRYGITAAEALARIDGLLAGLLEALASDVTLLLTSDHGNLEESQHRLHTRNPVPLLARGPLASRFADVRSLEEVTPRILSVLDREP